MVLGDYSLRFLRYVESLSKKVACFIDYSNSIYPDINMSITSGCYNDKQYTYQRGLRKHKAPLLKVLPSDITEKAPRRVFMPKIWTSEMENRLTNLLKDSSIKLIIFPIISIGESSKCSLDKNKHTVLLIYNKSTKSFEMWDDMYGETNLNFSLYKLYHVYIGAYLFPIFEKLGIEFKTKLISVPGYSEKWYMRIKRVLTANYYDNNYPAIYAAFLTDYISKRLKKSNVTSESLCKDVDLENIAVCYKKLLEHNREWQIKLQDICKNPAKLMNSRTAKCVSIESKEAKEILNINDEDNCPYPSLRNIDTDRCNKKLEIHSHYIDIDDESSYLTTHVTHHKWISLIKYLSKKYPYLATTPLNKFKWKMDKNTLDWNLTKPAEFDKIMKKGMTNPKVKYILFFITLQDYEFRWGHSNVLIIDKRARTVERFEPNEPEEWEDFQNGTLLDTAVDMVFSEFGLKYLPMEQTCPIGFQGLEEDSAGFKPNGGNCEIWSLWYADLRLANPDVPRLDLIKGAWKIMKKEGAFKQFIHGYHNFIRKELKKLK